jgi:hypothetical protein
MSATGTDADCFCIFGNAWMCSLIVGVVGISDQGWKQIFQETKVSNEGCKKK